MATYSYEQFATKVIDEHINSTSNAVRDWLHNPMRDGCGGFDYIKRQLKRFCAPFPKLIELFKHDGKAKREFIFDVLRRDEFWVESGTTLLFNTNRAAQNLVQGNNNPLSHFTRYQIACWFCLKADIKVLFDAMRERNRIGEVIPVNLAKSLRGRIGEADPLLEFWSYEMGDFHQLKSEGRGRREDVNVIGLDYALAMPDVQLDAVRFFCDALKRERRSGPTREAYWNNILMNAMSVLFVKNEKPFVQKSHIFNYLFVISAFDMDMCLTFFEDSPFHLFAYDLIVELVKDCHFGSAWKIFDSLSCEDLLEGADLEKWKELLVLLYNNKCHKELATELYSHIYMGFDLDGSYMN